MGFDLTGWSWVIYLAAVLQLVGFAMRDQIMLRIALLIGTVLYIVYYFLAPELPLWDAILMSVLLGLVNLYMLVKIMRDRYATLRTPEEYALYRMFYDFTPGSFRDLMDAGVMHQAKGPEILVQEGETADKMYFVIDGGVQIEKEDEVFAYMPGIFVGEVMYLSGGVASATVSVPSKTRYMAWTHEALEALGEKNEVAQKSLAKMLSHDMAQKVRFSKS